MLGNLHAAAAPGSNHPDATLPQGLLLHAVSPGDVEPHCSTHLCGGQLAVPPHTASMETVPTPDDEGPTHACSLLSALRMLTYAAWTRADNLKCLWGQLLAEAAHGTVQHTEHVKADIMHLRMAISPACRTAAEEGIPPPYEDALEVYLKLCELVDKPNYFQSIIKHVKMCATCGHRSESTDEVYTYQLVGKSTDDSGTELVERLVNHGLQHPDKYTCEACQHKNAYVTDYLHVVADTLVILQDDPPLHEHVIDLQRDKPRRRGGKVKHLRSAGLLWFRYEAGNEHYFLQEPGPSGVPRFYDPMIGLTDRVDTQQAKVTAVIYTATSARTSETKYKLPKPTVATWQQLRARARVASVKKVQKAQKMQKTQKAQKATSKRGQQRSQLSPSHRHNAVLTQPSVTIDLTTADIAEPQDVMQIETAHGQSSPAAPPKCTQPKTGPSITKDSRACTATDNNPDVSKQVRRSQTSESDCPHGVISLFDGLSTAVHAITKHLRRKPTAVLLAENDSTLRALVADHYGIDTSEATWQDSKAGCPIRYLSNVWTLFDDQANALKEFLTLLGPAGKIVLVAGSPCQDLTTVGATGGLYGFAGLRSVHFHAIPLLLHLLEEFHFKERTFLIMENAGSMLGPHQSYLGEVLGLQPTHVKVIDSGLWSDVQRRRTWITQANKAQPGTMQAQPWQAEWSPLPDLVHPHNRCVKLMPWLLHRGHTSSCNIVRTAGAYKLQNLLYHLPTWGGKQGLSNLLLQGKLMEAVTAHIPPGYVEAWECMQTQFKDTQANDTKTDFKRRQDAAAQALADLFENKDIALPFRLPTWEEQIRDSEISDLLHSGTHIDRASVEKSKFAHYIGNFFKPSALIAAVGGEVSSGLKDFLRLGGATCGPVKPAQPEDLCKLFDKLKQTIRADPRFQGLSNKFELAESPVPKDFHYLLSNGWSKQCRLFRQPKAFVVTALSLNKRPDPYDPHVKYWVQAEATSNHLPMWMNAKVRATLLSLGLERYPVMGINWHKRGLLPVHEALLQSMAECTGRDWAQSVTTLLLSLYDQTLGATSSQQPPVAILLIADALAAPILLATSQRPTALCSIIIHQNTVQIQYIASSQVDIRSTDGPSSQAVVDLRIQDLLLKSTANNLGVIFKDFTLQSSLLGTQDNYALRQILTLQTQSAPHWALIHTKQEARKFEFSLPKTLQHLEIGNPALCREISNNICRGASHRSSQHLLWQALKLLAVQGENILVLRVGRKDDQQDTSTVLQLIHDLNHPCLADKDLHVLEGSYSKGVCPRLRKFLTEDLSHRREEDCEALPLDIRIVGHVLDLMVTIQLDLNDLTHYPGLCSALLCALPIGGDHPT